MGGHAYWVSAIPRASRVLIGFLRRWPAKMRSAMSPRPVRLGLDHRRALASYSRASILASAATRSERRPKGTPLIDVFAGLDDIAVINVPRREFSQATGETARRAANKRQ
jgi:hypothetical protein